MKFKEIKAKVCANNDCKQVIPQEWTSSYNDEWCPRCGYGMPDKKKSQLRRDLLRNP